MTRHIALGNRELLVNIDEWLQVRDIFYPHPGQYNHVRGKAHRVAIIEDGRTSWLNGDDWERHVDYRSDTLLTESTAKNDDLGLSVELVENVYCEDNIFFRRVTVKNEASQARELRLAFTQDMCLYGDNVGDTAYYNPKRDTVTHYKDSAYLLTGVIDEAGASRLDGYDIGSNVHPERVRENSIAQGDVNSVLTTTVHVEAGGEATRAYFLCAGSSIDDVERLHDRFCGAGVKAHIDHADMCQRGWASSNTTDLSCFDDTMEDLYRRSLLLIKTQFDEDGAILAANDSDNLRYNRDTYSYMWPRDGALVAEALIEAGYAEMTRSFFTFCADVLYDEGCLLHKYNANKTLGSSWHPWVEDGEPTIPVQEDETALVLYALNAYYEATGDTAFINDVAETLIKPMTRFLWDWQHDNNLPKPSYDLWEERRGTYTFTTASVIAGLQAAQRLGEVIGDDELTSRCQAEYTAIKEAMDEHLYNEEDDHFRRGITYEDGSVSYDDTLDASAYATFAFGVYDADDPRVESTMRKVKDWLGVDTAVGGIARYHDDAYRQVSDDLDAVPGNPWFICTLWHAQWQIATASDPEDLEAPRETLRWAQDHALSTGVLPEQIHPYDGSPISVSPLTWSHAELVKTMTRYSAKHEDLT